MYIAPLTLSTVHEILHALAGNISHNARVHYVTLITPSVAECKVLQFITISYNAPARRRRDRAIFVVPCVMLLTSCPDLFALISPRFSLFNCNFELVFYSIQFTALNLTHKVLRVGARAIILFIGIIPSHQPITVRGVSQNGLILDPTLIDVLQY